MATRETSTSASPATPHVLRWLVTQGGSHDLIPGDVLRWDPSAKDGERVTIERISRCHSGDIDLMMLRGTLVCLDGATILSSRQALVLQLLKDREWADAQAEAA